MAITKLLNSYGPYSVGMLQYYLDNYCGIEIRKQILFSGKLILNEKIFATVSWKKITLQIGDNYPEIIIPWINFSDPKYNQIQEEKYQAVSIYLDCFKKAGYDSFDLLNAYKNYDKFNDIVFN